MPALLEQYLPPEGGVTEDALLEGYLSYAEDLGISLYPAQEEAILEVFADKSVVLNTPTGSGKSMVALAMCFKALAEGRRAFYTAPIKALVSEKFFDMCKVLGAENVGMMTGDASVNAGATVICCTAEILSNVALREGKDSVVDYVIMDEFHFYSDRERGVAWQIPLLTLPDVRFLLMSATLGDTTPFEKAIEELTGEECALVKTVERPVPLDYEYRLTPLHETINDLLEAKKVPIYIVHFTQRSAAEQAQNLMSIDFLTKEQKKAIKETVGHFRFDSPFGKELKRFTFHGVGVHHAGMLPKYRRLIERLAQDGHLKIICGTDTLGVGVNIPIRSVLFTKLCKYDGEKTGVLKVRDFQQIAGRAGRKGFDDQGSVVAQAPEHVVENESMRNKAAGDAKKMRKLRLKKPPDRGYAHWDEKTFVKLREGEPEKLTSRFKVTHGMLLNVLAREEGGCAAMKTLIRSSHESPRRKREHGRKAIAMVRSLRDAGIVTLGTRDGKGEVTVNADLQSDFSLNQALSLYVVEAVSVFDRDAPDYALDIVTLVEAILEDPRAVLMGQLNTLKGRAVAEMKMEGIEYDERMEKLEKIENPKPKKDLLYATFDVFRENNPWAYENIRPKSIVREMYELGMTFREYVKEHGLPRSEGVLLRYLTEAYKALVQNVPENAKTDEVYDLTEWLEGEVRAVDSSLLDEWAMLRDGVDEKELAAREEEVDETDITRDEKSFTVLVRNEVWRLVKAIARRESDRAEAMVSGDWNMQQIMEAMQPYWATYDELRTDPVARNPRYLEVTKESEHWTARQILIDPEDHREWSFTVKVSLAAARESGKVSLELISLGTA